MKSYLDGDFKAVPEFDDKLLRESLPEEYRGKDFFDEDYE